MSDAPGSVWTLAVCARGMIGPNTPTDVRHALEDVAKGAPPPPDTPEAVRVARSLLLSHPYRACRLLALRQLGATAAERAALAAAGDPVPDEGDELGAAGDVADDTP